MNGDAIDLRSDSGTRPTPEMIEAMRTAEIGAYSDHDDPTVAALEVLGAKRFNKEAALFVPSVTMANVIAYLVYCRPGEQVIVDEDAHVYRNEVSGITRVAGLTPRVVPRTGALPSTEAIARALAYRSGGATPVKLLWLENTHNVGGGAAADRAATAAAVKVVQDKAIRVHVDGARIFNAAVALNVTVADLVSDVDSISVGFAKGLSCPMGALLVGSRALVEEALPLRRMLGGRLLKAGVAAAACTVALNTMVERLSQDHAAARRLGEAVEEIPGLRLESPVVTNIARFDTSGVCPAKDFVAGLAERNILMGAVGPFSVRAVTHRHITSLYIERVIESLRLVARTLEGSRSRAATH